MFSRFGFLAVTPRLRVRFFEPTSVLRNATSTVSSVVDTALTVSNFSSQHMVVSSRPCVSRAPSSSCEVKDQLKPVSDHSLYYVSFAIETVNGKPLMVARTPENRGLPGFKVAVLNMMMQGKKRRDGYNNAFQLEETSEQYRARVSIIVGRLAEQIRKHPDIDLIFLQEAPIDDNIDYIIECFKRQLPQEFEASISGTPWGLMVVANEKKMPGIMQNLKVTNSGPMKDRLLTVRLPHLNTEISTLHAPHTHPECAIDKIKTDMHWFVRKNVLRQRDGFSFFYIGDFNNSAEVIQKAPRRVYEDIFNPQMAVRCSTIVGSNVDGHQDASGKKLTVDHVVGATFRIEDYDTLLQAMDRVRALEGKAASLSW